MHQLNLKQMGRTKKVKNHRNKMVDNNDESSVNLNAINNFVNINSVTFNLVVNNIKNVEIKEFDSNIVFVRGIPWLISLSKNSPKPEDAGQSQLAIYLYALNEDKSKNWAIFAKASIKILTSNIEQKPFEGVIDSFVYSSHCNGWGEHSFIAWNKLLDPANGYVNDDGSCKFLVKIDAGPLQDLTKDGLMKFQRIERCCQNVSIEKFQLTIQNLNDFVDVCSPEFFVRQIPWSLMVLKSDKLKKINNIETKSTYLCVQLYNRIDDEHSNRLCRATMNCKLLSFKENIQPVVAHIQNTEFKLPFMCKCIDLIEWNEMIKAEKHFIQDNTIVIEVEIKIESTEGYPDDWQSTAVKTEKTEIQHNLTNSLINETRTQKRRLSTESNLPDNSAFSIELSCIICQNNMIGRDLSITKCGHMYCTNCIEEYLRKRPICPNCRAKSTIHQLRSVNFPVLLSARK